MPDWDDDEDETVNANGPKPQQNAPQRQSGPLQRPVTPPPGPAPAQPQAAPQPPQQAPQQPGPQQAAAIQRPTGPQQSGPQQRPAAPQATPPAAAAAAMAPAPPPPITQRPKNDAQPTIFAKRPTPGAPGAPGAQQPQQQAPKPQQPAAAQAAPTIPAVPLPNGNRPGGPAPQNGMRQGPPPQRPPMDPAAAQTQIMPPTPGGARPPKPGEAQTEVIPPTPAGRIPGRPEPALLTHPDGTPATQIQANTPPPPRGPQGPGGPGDGEGDGPRRIDINWPKVRQWSLIGLAACVLIPGVAFIIGWFVFSPPDPNEIAAKQQSGITIAYTDGSQMVKDSGSNPNRTVLPSNQISQHMKDAAIAAEDPSFLTNKGFDPLGVLRAVAGQAGLVGKSGGSGITQQYIKVATDNDEYSYTRKFKEMVMAAKMTSSYDKDVILTGYLNTVFFGRTGYGIEEAAKAYFGVHASELTVQQSALLAGLIQRPSQGNTKTFPQVIHDRFEYALDAMVKNGSLKESDRKGMAFPETKNPTISLADGPKVYIKNLVLDELKKTGLDANTVRTKGYRIVTTINEQAQTKAEQAAAAIMQDQPEYLRTSLVATDPKTGGIIAYYGGTFDDDSQFDFGSNPLQPGSSFKPFVMAASLEQGGSIYDHYDGSSPRTFQGHYEVSNSEGKGYGNINAAVAMQNSVNTVFVDMALKTKVQNVRRAALEAGIPELLPNGKPSLQEADGSIEAGIALGQYGVRTVDMANAYGTFANDGVKHQAHVIEKIINPVSGEPVWSAKKEESLAFDENNPSRNKQIARNVTKTLQPIAGSSGIGLKGGRPTGAKTGTVQLPGSTIENSAAWMVGFTPSVSTAVWVGAKGNQQAIRGNYVSATRGRNHPIYGAAEPGYIWQKFMNDYLANSKQEAFPPATIMGDTQEDVPSSSSAKPSTTSTKPSSEDDERNPAKDPRCSSLIPPPSCYRTTTPKPGDPTDPNQPSETTKPGRPGRPNQPPDLGR
ncbi:penicillin-binding protein [Pseudonocardiaceae bacterium YIM PH 21723]|nr:penicillin-binding protein [Pseudonocardiaceae bacterium YIM PH 21723]